MFLSSRLKITILSVIPLIIAVLALKLRSAAGPFWLGVNSDPSYIHLVNSLYLLDHITPIFVDHPGITLQMLGAVIIKALSLNIASQDITNNVFDNPEYYLNAIYASLLFFYIGSLILVGYYAFKKTKNVLFALLVQTPSFLYLTLKSYGGDSVLPIIANVNSGTLLLTFCNLYVMCLIKLYFDTKSRDNIISAMLLGIVCALGLATKVPFLPLILVPLILLPRYKPRFIFILTLVSSWVIVTLPIVPRYGKMYAWLKGILTHSGFHGSGNKGFIKIDSFISALKGIIVGNAFFSMAIGVCLGVVLYYALFRSRVPQGNNDSFKRTRVFLSVLILVAVMQFLMVAKQPAPQYMVPGVSLFGILLALLYWSFPYTARIRNIGALAFLFLFMGFRTVSAMHYQSRLRETNRGIYDFSREIHSKYQDSIICGFYRSSSVGVALYFGDDCAGYKKYGPLLRVKFPDSFYWNLWDHTFHHYDKKISLKTLMQANANVLLYGTPMSFPGYIQVEPMEVSQGEGVYKITSETINEAVTHYIVAKIFESKKNYKTAYGYAVKAKAFGYPRMDPYMNTLRDLIIRNP